jgi:glutathione synthase/RimK-type ligase-like ATP-grasp enzyme
MPTTADVALLTDRRYTADTAAPDDWYLGNILADDRLLQAALTARGLSSGRIDWADESIDWSRFKCAVFRTTWDYFERFPEFVAWLDRIEQRTRVCNPIPTVRWNMNKRYLVELALGEVPIVPSAFLIRGSSTTLAEIMDHREWQEAVFKPCVSGAARHTHRVTRADAERMQPLFASLVAAEQMIVQPFLTDVPETGEDTLMLFGGKFSHAVRKVAKAGDFRVQDDFGGTVQPYTPTAEQIEVAERTMEVVSRIMPMPVYGRVDLVRDNWGRLAVMELELIEPELWLRFHPPAADHFADGVVAFLAGEQ